LLGVLCKEVGQLRRGESCYRRALPIFVRALGRLHPSVATIYHNLGGILYAQGLWGRAEHWTRRAVAVRTAGLGRRHAAVVADEACLAPILAARGKHVEAEALYRRAIRFFSGRPRGRYDVAINSSNLGVLLEATGRFRAAEAAYRLALRSYRALRHAPPHDVALALHNLGVLRARAGGTDAEILLEQALDIFRRTLGSRHTLTRESRRHLSELRTSSEPSLGAQRFRSARTQSRRVSSAGRPKAA